MSGLLATASVISTLSLFTPAAHAASYTGSDSFSGSELDPELWKAGVPPAYVTLQDGRLWVVSRSAEEQGELFWNKGVLPLNEDWEIRADLYLREAEGEGNAPGFSRYLMFSLRQSDEPGNRHEMYLFLSDEPRGGIRWKRHFIASRHQVKDNPTLAAFEKQDVVSEWISVRMSYYAETRQLECFLDPNGPANGYSWILISKNMLGEGESAWSSAFPDPDKKSEASVELLLLSSVTGQEVKLGDMALDSITVSRKGMISPATVRQILMIFAVVLLLGCPIAWWHGRTYLAEEMSGKSPQIPVDPEDLLESEE